MFLTQTIQHQLQPGMPFTPATLPTGVSGIAWMRAWEPPDFPTKYKTPLHQTWAGRIDTAIPVAVVSGQAYNVPWEPPRFRGVPAERQQTEFWFQTPATLPVGIAGVSWMRPWEPPFFPTRFRVELQQTQLYQGNIAIFPPPVAGISWMRGWEPPRFRGVPSELQQSELAVVTSQTLPPLTAGMWWTPFDQPFFPTRVKVQLQQTSDSAALIPGTLPAKVSGMSWFYNFDQPKQRRVDPLIQQYSFQVETNTFLPAAYSAVYIIF